MRGLENRLIDELEPIAMRSTTELAPQSLYRGHLAVVNKLRYLIIAENGLLEVRQACLGCLRCAGNRVEITEITREILWITGASLNDGEGEPAQLVTLDKVRTTRINGIEFPDAHQMHGCL